MIFAILLIIALLAIAIHRALRATPPTDWFDKAGLVLTGLFLVGLLGSATLAGPAGKAVADALIPIWGGSMVMVIVVGLWRKTR